MAKHIYKQDDCVHCETCVNCSRRKGYYLTVYECDMCDAEGTDVELYETTDGKKQLCASCLTDYEFKSMSQAEIIRELYNMDFWDDVSDSFASNGEFVKVV